MFVIIILFQARATETCGLILSAMSNGAVDDTDVIQKGVPDVLQPHQVKACSMITEGAVHVPSPAYPNWPVSERNFRIGNARVLFIMHFLKIQFENVYTVYGIGTKVILIFQTLPQQLLLQLLVKRLYFITVY